MCGKLTLLAKANATRYIAQCEHGTIHIVWDNVSVRLCQADFLSITANTCKGLTTGGERDKGQGFWLKMPGVALQFQPESLAIMKDLMCLAIINMNKAMRFV